MHYLDAHDAHLGDAATLQDPVWFAAMEQAFNALTDNGIWSLVPCSRNVNVVTNK